MTWIDKDLLLQGEKVTLRPMRPEHIDGLILAGSSQKLWEFLPMIVNEAHMRAYYAEAMENREKGTQFPFTIFDKDSNIIGTTRFGDIEPEHRKLEIGWTWYRPDLWGKGHNEECKYLLLSYCFETLKTVRVQLKTHEKNIRSRRAVLRLGCKFEGILRNHIIRAGLIRNTAMFSMLPEEWEAAKPRLRAIADSKYAGTYRYHPEHVTHDGYTLTTNKALMQPERIHQWLTTKSYWVQGVPFEVVKTALDSCFCIGVFHNGVQIGYARLVTDYARFGFLMDVYIEEEHRGKGLSKKMMELLLSLDWVKNLGKLVLGTKDAHGLYAQFGFATPAFPDQYMEKAQTPSWRQ